MSDPGLEIVKAWAEGTATGFGRPGRRRGAGDGGVCRGRLADALDGFVASRLRQRSVLRYLKFLARAREMCDAAGIEPAVVNDKLLAPLCSGAALEDDESMADKWAAFALTSFLRWKFGQKKKGAAPTPPLGKVEESASLWQRVAKLHVSQRSVSLSPARASRGLSDDEVEHLNLALGYRAAPRSQIVNGQTYWDH